MITRIHHYFDADGLAIAGYVTDALIPGTPDDDHLTGTEDADLFDLSQGGHDEVAALAGDDVLLFGATLDAFDRIDGGDGEDAVALAGSYDLTLTAAMLTSVEELRLGIGGDYSLTLAADLVLVGSHLSIVAEAGGMPATIRVDGSAAAGDLLFHAGGGDDKFIGGAGNDVFHASVSGTDRFVGGTAGFDRLDLSGLAGGVILDLGDGNTQQVGGASLSVSGIDAVWGTSGNDAIAGTILNNWIVGGGGNDQLYGRNGNDLIEVGVFDGAVTTNGLVDGGNGRQDVVSFAALGEATGGVTVSLTTAGLQDTGQGVFRLVRVEGISGTSFDDTLIGSNAGDLLLGGDGSDVLTGRTGSDQLYGDAVFATLTTVGGDLPPTVRESGQPGGDDVLDGGRGNDALVGGGGNDTLLGGFGGDQLDGGLGDDTLRGGTSADLMFGGAGVDRYIFGSTTESAANAPDTIGDFESGDIIDVRQVDANSTLGGDQAFHFGATREHVGDIVTSYDFRHNLTVVDFYTNSDRIPDMTINLTGNIAISAADFVL